jgi:pimeloyl-ACP methyl ester carboxylesterase
MNRSPIPLLLAIALTWATTPSFAQDTAPPPKPAKQSHGKYAEINGMKLYYEVHGTGGTPLILLHGGGSTIETTFGKILPLLAESRQVIAYEQQGHGHTTDIADRPFTFEQSADDAAALLKHLNIKQADFFGFSNGGSIAMQVAIRHPSLVRKLVIASAMTKRSGLHPEIWKFIEQSKLENMPKEYQDAYQKLSPHPDRLRQFHDKCAKRMIDFQDWPDSQVRSIKAPTLIVVGDQDSIRPEHAVEMFRLIPKSQLAILPGGHGTYIGEVTAARMKNSQVTFDSPADSARKPDAIPNLVVAMINEFLDTPTP